ncbi:MAG: toxin-antitoxin system HicB family antitoxin [Desulfuromonadales bacterium]|nr:toxin-antitoxin system HicB family antitoxin [Desulfuromonadales bacterium]
MSAINVRLPDSLHRMAKEVATQDHISLNQFITSAIAEKISALTTESYLEERAGRSSRDKFQKALAKAPDVEPEAFDRI